MSAIGSPLSRSAAAAHDQLTPYISKGLKSGFLPNLPLTLRETNVRRCDLSWPIPC